MQHLRWQTFVMAALCDGGPESLTDGLTLDNNIASLEAGPTQ